MTPGSQEGLVLTGIVCIVLNDDCLKVVEGQPPEEQQFTHSSVGRIRDHNLANPQVPRQHRRVGLLSCDTPAKRKRIAEHDDVRVADLDILAKVPGTHSHDSVELVGGEPALPGSQPIEEFRIRLGTVGSKLNRTAPKERAVIAAQELLHSPRDSSDPGMGPPKQGPTGRFQSENGHKACGKESDRAMPQGRQAAKGRGLFHSVSLTDWSS
jgi:hypothetical protein